MGDVEIYNTGSEVNNGIVILLVRVMKKKIRLSKMKGLTRMVHPSARQNVASILGIGGTPSSG